MPNQSTWPSPAEFVEAIQNPGLCFRDPDLRDTVPAVDKFGLPLISSGQFASVFKLKEVPSGDPIGLRCFRGFLGDREQRYSAISSHLNNHKNSILATFEFDVEGIFVAGRGQRYPIVEMEWISGPTLDSYVEQVLSRSEILAYLADEWVTLVRSLHDSQIAHGDLQHGNIIVHDGRLRLVDLDGMFVPSMKGWQASELGHIHYQHPGRTTTFFGPTLDNFSSLVIYLSLKVLPGREELWHQYHDENLIFTKADFLDPSTSKLFSKIKAIGGDVKKLAEALELAAKSPPSSTPYLLDIVSPKVSRLPAWMRQPAGVAVKERTREAPSGSSPPQVTSSPPQISPASSPFPSAAKPAPASSTSLGVPSSQAPPPLVWSKVLIQTFAATALYAFIGTLFYWIWFPVLTNIYKAFGMASGYEELAVLTFLSSCAVLALRRTLKLERAKAASISIPSQKAPPPVLQVQRVPRSTWPTYAPRSQPYVSLVGSRIRRIYHTANCEWARKISYRNRVTFASASAAQAQGYRRCRVCLP